MEELDLVECLVAQVASLSSSLACEVAIVESPTPPPMDLQSNFVIPSATPLIVDALAAVVGSLIAPWWSWTYMPPALGSPTRRIRVTSLPWRCV
jgi:hypothetical protein